MHEEHGATARNFLDERCSTSVEDNDERSSTCVDVTIETCVEFEFESTHGDVRETLDDVSRSALSCADVRATRVPSNALEPSESGSEAPGVVEPGPVRAGSYLRRTEPDSEDFSPLASSLGTLPADRGSESGSARLSGAHDRAVPAELGARLGVARTTNSALRGTLVGDDVPPFPGHSIVPIVRVPEMPRLSIDDDEVDRVRVIVSAYRAVVSRLTNKPCFAYTRGSIEKSRGYAQLVAASEVLVEHEIPPHGWARFAIEQWKSKSTNKPPSAAWMFAATRIKRWRGWYRTEAATHEHGTTRIVDAQRELIETYQKMQGELRRKKPADRQAVRDVVSQFFPPGVFDTLVAKACRDADTLRAQLVQRLNAGEWIWD